MKIIFINIPWMKYYTGEGDEEKEVPLSGYNFQYNNGTYYGYGEGLNEIAIENLDGIGQGDQCAEDVLVVWTANNASNQNRIIGWYKQATVYRNKKEILTLDSDRAVLQYSISAQAEGCMLLPPELRLFDLGPLEEGVWFEKDTNLIKDIAMYVHNYQGEQMNKLLDKKDLTTQSVLNFADYEMFFAKADEFLAKDLYGKAIRCFNKAIALEPELAIGYECKGSILLSLKMYDEALAVYKKVIEIEGGNEEAAYCVGLLNGLTGNYDKCVEYLSRSIEKSGQDANTIAERGIAYYNLGDTSKAKADFEKAYQIEPDHSLIKRLIHYA